MTLVNLKRIVTQLALGESIEICGSAPARIIAVRFGAVGSDYDIHPASEAVLILSGALTLEMDGVTHVLTEGDFIRIAAGTRHRVVSATPGMLLLFETP